MSVYTTATLGAPDNLIEFNNYTIDPVFRVLARAPRNFQLRQQELSIPFEDGISDFLTLIGSTLYILSGKMYPGNENSYDSGLMALRSVCSLELNQADILSDNGYVPYKWGDAVGNLSKQVFLKPLYAQISETTQQGFVQPFTIYAKIKDPTIYGTTLKSASTGQANPSQSTGSAIYPFVYPVLYGATVYTVTADCNNVGTLPVYPITTFVKGPINKPKLTNQATGEYIEVDVNLGSSSDQLNITYDKDTLDVNLNGVNVVNKVTAGSSYFKIRPGTNTIQLSGTSVSTGAAATVEFYDGWPLS